MVDWYDRPLALCSQLEDEAASGNVLPLSPSEFFAEAISG